MNVYGPRQDYHGAYIAVLHEYAQCLERGERPTILGDLSEAIGFVAVKDCGRPNVCAMKAHSSTASFYGVGTGKRTSLRELAECSLRSPRAASGSTLRPRSQAMLARKCIGDRKRAARKLGFIAEIRLRNGLDDLTSPQKAKAQSRANHERAVVEKLCP